MDLLTKGVLPEIMKKWREPKKNPVIQKTLHYAKKRNIYQGDLYFKNASGIEGARVNIVQFMSIRKAQPSMRVIFTDTHEERFTASTQIRKHI
jgi:hypothetical protein